MLKGRACNGRRNIDTGQCSSKYQIFCSCEFGFDPGKMTDIAQFTPVGLTLLPDRRIAPQHITAAGQQQSAEHAQQAGLARAVGTGYPQQSTGRHRKRKVSKQLASAADTMQVLRG